MGFSIAKLLGGYAIWQGEKLGKLIYNLSIIAVCLGIFWAIFIKPTHSTHQTAQTIQNITTPSKEDFSFVGVKLWKFKIGVTIQ